MRGPRLCDSIWAETLACSRSRSPNAFQIRPGPALRRGSPRRACGPSRRRGEHQAGRRYCSWCTAHNATQSGIPIRRRCSSHNVGGLTTTTSSVRLVVRCRQGVAATMSVARVVRLTMWLTLRLSTSLRQAPAATSPRSTPAWQGTGAPAQSPVAGASAHRPRVEAPSPRPRGSPPPSARHATCKQAASERLADPYY